MQSVARSSVRSVPRLRGALLAQQKRQASHGQKLEPQQPSAAPPNESYGSGFYAAILCIPAAFGLYSISQPTKDGQDPYFTTLIKKAYADYAQKNQTRNDLHTSAIEQAAEDRTLFLNDAGQYHRHVDHRFPELMNSGSPYNVPAGHGHANIDALIAKYQKEANEMQEIKLQQLRDNKVPREQPLVGQFTKDSPAALE